MYFCLSISGVSRLLLFIQASEKLGGKYNVNFLVLLIRELSVLIVFNIIADKFVAPMFESNDQTFVVFGNALHCVYFYLLSLHTLISKGKWQQPCFLLK